MNIDLKQIFELTNEQKSIKYDYDLADYELFFSKPFITPVNIKGMVSNNSSVVTFDYTASFTLKLICDRCLSEFCMDNEYSFSHTLVQEQNTDSDEYILLLDSVLDLDELCLSDILLKLPSKILCDEDCLGLCHKCGINLNEHQCECVKKEIDPRLMALSQLLESDD